MKCYNGVAMLSRLPLASRARGRGAAGAIAVTLSPCCRAARSCTISTSRPAATCPIPRPIRSSPTSCSSSRRWRPGSPPARSRRPRTIDPGRRPQRRAARERRLVAQADARRRLPHAGRGRAPGGGAGLGAAGSMRCATSCRPSSGSIRGGAIAPAIGPRPTAGRRLDHVWVSEPVAPSLAAAQILEHARGWELPSDHVP